MKKSKKTASSAKPAPVIEEVKQALNEELLPPNTANESAAQKEQVVLLNPD